ncbi:MAG TPA: glycosyltransferase family 2 protein [Candidatus Humimicrobiaceae bacterium]
MDISIIIVNYNSLDFIKKCIGSIREHIGKNSMTREIVVVDNDSNDGSVEYLKDETIGNEDFNLIINESNLGFSKASNIGASRARGQYLLFLNPDTRFIKGSLADLVGFYDRKEKIGKVGIVGAKVLNPDGALQLSTRSFPTLARQFYESYFLYRIFKGNRIFGSYFMTWWNHGSEMKVDWLSGSFMFIKKDNFIKAGMFDEDYFMYSEDTDICLRLHRKDFSNYYYPDFLIEHSDSGIASKAMAIREAGIWKSRRLYFKKNYSAFHARCMSFIYLAGIINRILLFAVLAVFKPHSRSKLRLKAYFKVLGLYFGDSKI